MADILKLVNTAVDAIDSKKGLNIKVLNIQGLSPISDYFILASGTNQNQLHAMSDEVLDKLAKEDVHAKSIEGYQAANWILMDYGDFMVHLFTEESREFYNLERIWKDAKIEN